MNTAHQAAKPGQVRVCMGGAVVQDYPLQSHATAETLRNIYFGHCELPASDIASYNRMTDEINRATYHTTREFLLDQRHRCFVAAMYAQRTALQAAAQH